VFPVTDEAVTVVTPKSTVEIPPPARAVLLLIVELVAFTVPSSLKMPPPGSNAVLPLTVTCDRFAVLKQHGKLIPPPVVADEPFVTVKFRTVKTTKSAVTVNTEPVAFPFNVAVEVPPWIVTLTGTVKFPTHGNGPKIVTVPPPVINGCNPAISVAATPVHVYDPLANAEPTPNDNTTTATAATNTSSDSPAGVRLPDPRILITPTSRFSKPN